MDELRSATMELYGMQVGMWRIICMRCRFDSGSVQHINPEMLGTHVVVGPADRQATDVS